MSIKMLDYEKQIFLDILQEDGLVVAAKGLGLDSVIVNLLKVYCDPGNLVFVLGTEDQYQEWLVRKLILSGVDPPPTIVSSELGASEREQSYLKGGLWFVPTRILIVDLIKKRIPINLITGFVVCKAHNILKNHQDSFVIRLYRQGNKTGFIKAFSNQAVAFRGGFSKVEQILKSLFLRNLFLWPRYHATVKSTLNEFKPTVVEIHLEMTGKMVQLQNSLLDLIKYLVQELKRLNPLLDTEEVTVENAISGSFHKLLHSQLDPVWHALSERTKTLLADLKLFHHMTMALLTTDCISFFSLVNSQRRTDCALKSSGWHLLPSAEILFTVARQRVFPKSNNITDMDELDAEANPKWLALSQVLNEIHRTSSKIKKSDEAVEECDKSSSHSADDLPIQDSHLSDSMCDLEGDVLILVRDERTCSQLKGFLTLGSKEFLKSQYRKQFFHKKIGMKSKEQADAKTEHEEDEENEDIEDQEADLDVCSLSLCREVTSQLENNSEVNLAGFFEDTFTQAEKYKNSQMTQKMSQEEAKHAPLIIVIKSYKRNIMYFSQVLQKMKPKWVIIYDSDITLVRQLEVYKRKNPTIALTIYFLVYGGTIEEQAYLTSLRKEKEAFDYLIEEKARMVIPEDRSDCPELTRDASKASAVTSRTRQGGLQSLNKAPSKIIVDMREFRSELPALIHSRGIDIEPVTISIGDYILTPDICLERKSVSDLIQSLNSGRLYNQALAMTRHYSRAMLLIEFDKDKPFDLQDRYYLSTDASSNQLVTKLQLLTLHFPKLRIVWSPSPYATAELFEELKEGRPEPDAAVAAGLGIEETAKDDDTFNPTVQNFLSKLPGVTTKNIYALLHKCKSLDYLNKMSKNEICEAIENSADAEIIFNAFHKRHEPASQESKPFSGPFRRKRKRFH